MKSLPLVLGAVLILAACGVDGVPERPESGLTITGTAEFGIEGGQR
ncbi:hypothetical protein [Rhodovulum adriaticum]|uniref:Uncharacterized protein n=1 Tax=Rhodovulum adriaticum TaxID=35804 RepID=A0A4R2NKD0_RHOAD|nr:hypothetical protein [Rhodovulum adriaticum]TCP22049.1 hypothetical protein EV656_10895 [Rhodovulum adriaticum]